MTSDETENPIPGVFGRVLSPEDTLRAALARSRQSLSREGAAAPGDAVSNAAEATGSENGDAPIEPADAAPHRKPMIDRGNADTTGSSSSSMGLTAGLAAINPFTAAPPVLPASDSGAGMGFEFSLLRRDPRRLGR